MKKVLLFATLFLTISVVAIAQPRAIGGRLGSNLEVSYQHSLGKNFVELDAGLVGFGAGFQLTGIYNFIVLSPNWTPQGEWNLYAGPGLGVGHRGSYYENHGATFVGVAGQVGLEYTFAFPLQLSVDYRPLVGMAFGKDIDYNSNTHEFKNSQFYSKGFFDLALSVRYRF